MARQRFVSRIQNAWSYYVPAVVRPFLEWLLGISETSAVWDIRTALLVIVFRALFNDPTPVSMFAAQEASFAKSQLIDSISAIEDTMLAPNRNNLIYMVKKAINGLSQRELLIPEVGVAPVKGEWVHSQSSPGNDMVIIYLHGGQFYLRNAASRRSLVHDLTRRTGGQAFSMSYRLSPQHTFPAALVDLFVVYLSLLYPLKNSQHAAFQATSISICGDSSGANLAVAFLQLILELQRQALGNHAMVQWNEQDVIVPCPRAIGGHSGYMDLTRSLPSELENLKFDLIPSPSGRPVPSTRYIQDMIWPPVQPRHHVYAPSSLLTHPLVSPVTTQDWGNCPTKVWLSVGQECLADGSILLAKRMAEQSVEVILEMYEGLPHDFLLLFGSSRAGQECLNRWGVALTAKASQKCSTASFRRVDGAWQEIEISQMEPHIEGKELIQRMEDVIAQWGNPWTRTADEVASIVEGCS